MILSEFARSSRAKFIAASNAKAASRLAKMRGAKTPGNGLMIIRRG